MGAAAAADTGCSITNATGETGWGRGPGAVVAALRSPRAGGGAPAPRGGPGGGGRAPARHASALAMLEPVVGVIRSDSQFKTAHATSGLINFSFFMTFSIVFQ